MTDTDNELFHKYSSTPSYHPDPLARSRTLRLDHLYLWKDRYGIVRRISLRRRREGTSQEGLTQLELSTYDPDERQFCVVANVTHDPCTWRLLEIVLPPDLLSKLMPTYLNPPRW